MATEFLYTIKTSIRYTLFLVFSIHPVVLFSQQVTIDFSNQYPVNSQSGFLHGLFDTWNDPSTIPIPDDSLVAPLKPKYWRIGTYHPGVYNKIKGSFNPEMILVVSDIYGYPFNWPVAPYADTATWLAKIDLICTNTAGFDVIYDIWNEPDIGFFWNGTYQQFLATFKLAHNRIRQNLGSNVRIAGPSLGYMDTTLIRQFCDFAVVNGLKIDVFAQHWLEPYIPGNAKLLSDLNWLQTNIVNNPVYQSLQIQKLVVAEIVGEPQQYKPGPILSHFYFLEKGGADGACKGCWDAMDGSGTNNCFNSSLDGILTSGTFLKRPAWWVYKSYADLEEIRFATTSTDPNIVVLAGRLSADTNTLRLMMGNYTDYQPPWLNTISLTLSNLLSVASIQSTDTLELRCYKIPDKGTDTLANPILLWIDTIPVNQIPIAAINANVDSNSVVFIDCRTLRHTAPTGTGVALKNFIKLYPNPTTGSFSIELDKEYETVDIGIYNMIGQQINHVIHHNVQSVPATINGTKGIYLLKVVINNKQVRILKVSQVD